MTGSPFIGLELRSIESGVVLKVKANPGAKSNSIGTVHDGALRVSVTQVAEKGKANKVIIGLLAKCFGTARSNIALMNGLTHSSKLFLIKGETPQSILASLQKKASNQAGL